MLSDRTPRGRFVPRPSMSAMALTAWVTAFLFIPYNATFWSIGVKVFAGHWVQLAVFVAALYCLTVAAFSIFSFRPIVKPFLAFILILSASTSYFMDKLGVVIDRDMIQNVATTTVTEAKHLVTFDLLVHIALFGILPALSLTLVEVRRQRRLVALAVPPVTFALSIAIALGLIYTNYRTYSSILREHKEFLASYQPGAPLVGAIRYARLLTMAANVTAEPLGTDATKGEEYAASDKPVLVIVVAGETARAQDFSLNGYPRPTNPELAGLDVINFSNVHSCGTATATSLPCMFSKYGRDEYSHTKGLATENLLDVLTHSGIAVQWWDNNTGDKSIASRVEMRSFTNSKDPDHCDGGECEDGIFLKNLRAFAPTIMEDTVLVFHQIGSHGPSYYLRYPEAFERFKPACRSVEFTECSLDEIVNAYDNTIAYTDHVLAQTIEFLRERNGLSTALLYVSDHGESLGEEGLFLHGAPYFMAPEEQVRVPMILWMSDTFREEFAISDTCVAAKSDDSLSHDNLFHSVLGMLDIRTSAYDARLDIFDGCRDDRSLTRR